MAVEREIEKTETAPQPNAVFDESSNFLLYATLLGIKVRYFFKLFLDNIKSCKRHLSADQHLMLPFSSFPLISRLLIYTQTRLPEFLGKSKTMIDS